MQAEQGMGKHGTGKPQRKRPGGPTCTGICACACACTGACTGICQCTRVCIGTGPGCFPCSRQTARPGTPCLQRPAQGARGAGRGACGSVDLEGSAVLPSVYTDSRSAARCWRVLWLFLPAARASSTVNWWALPLSCAARPPWAAISRWRAGSMAAKPRRAGLRSSCKALRTPLVLSAAVRPPVLAEGCAVAPAARLAPWYADRGMAWESVLLLAVMYFSPLGWEPLVRSAEAFFSTTHR